MMLLVGFGSSCCLRALWFSGAVGFRLKGVAYSVSREVELTARRDDVPDGLHQV